jgi:N-acetyl sugar amidotransferase
MDTTDPEIIFSDSGVCNHCIKFENVTSREWFPDDEGGRRLEHILEQIKNAGSGRSYDCILGLSGGVDSSYLALQTSKWGLRPLVVHVDAGWNSELAVSNIEKIVKHCNFDLYTHVVDWQEMRNLQLAYFNSAVANQDVPQDHVFFASMYHFAIKNGIRFILSGGNIATEGVFPSAWHGSAMDAINLKAINRLYGQGPLASYNTISFFQYYIWYPFVKRLRTVRPLNYMRYNKAEAIVELKKEIGWRSYDSKHGESLFTKFFQNYYLPFKFGYDKRRPHLSSLIASGQMSRDEALAKLEEALYLPDELESDKKYLCKKLGISSNEFDRIMSAPIHNYDDFPNWSARQRFLKKLQGIITRVTGHRMSVYS